MVDQRGISHFGIVPCPVHRLQCCCIPLTPRAVRPDSPLCMQTSCEYVRIEPLLGNCTLVPTAICCKPKYHKQYSYSGGDDYYADDGYYETAEEQRSSQDANSAESVAATKSAGSKSSTSKPATNKPAVRQATKAKRTHSNKPHANMQGHAAAVTTAAVEEMKPQFAWIKPSSRVDIPA